MRKSMTEGAKEDDNEIGRAGRASAALLAQSGGLAYSVAEEVERRPARGAVTGHFDLLDAGRVHHEGAFDADPRSDAAHRDHPVQPTVAHAKDRPLELLETFAVSLDDAHAHGNGVTRPDLWDLGLLLLGGKRLQDVVHRHGDSAH